jgi:hypothetical protein
MRGSEAAAAAAPARSGNNRTVMIAAAAAVVVAVGAFLLMGRGGGPSAPQVQTVVIPGGGPAPAASDDGSQKRIDEMVASLAAQYREGKTPAQQKPTDEWTSKPLTMVFMDVRAEDAGGDKAVNMLSLKVTQALQAEGRVQMVERELLDKLLAELKLSSSSLADPNTALKLGKLLSARVMVTGSIVPEGKGMTIALRFIDTETTAVRKVITVDAPSKDMDRAVAENVAKGINEWAKADMPIQGRVLSVAGATCMVNLGQAHGLKKGDKMDLLKEAKKGTGLFAAVGEIEVSQVAKDRAEAKIVAKAGAVSEGTQVRIKQ